jgi:hypothetical protein
VPDDGGLAARDFKRINRNAPPADAGARMTDEEFEAEGVRVAENYGPESRRAVLLAEARRARAAERELTLELACHEKGENCEACEHTLDLVRSRDALAARVAALTEALREIGLCPSCRVIAQSALDARDEKEEKP